MRLGPRDLLVALTACFVLFGGTEQPAPPETEIVADHQGALAEVVIHYTPTVERDVAPAYRDLLRALEPDVTVWVVVERREHFRRLADLLPRWGVRSTKRFRPVVTGRPITTWSRDRYTLLRSGAGERRLLVRARPEEGPAPRRNDWQAPFALARAAGRGVTVERAPLLFDGGDLIATDRHVLATALLQARNEGGTLGERGPLRDWLRRHLGREPVIIGDRAEDVPGHHIGMFVTPISNDVVLVGDVAAGLSLLPAEVELPLAVDRSRSTAGRFARVARELRAHGFVVRPVPLVPLEDGLTYLTYNNVLLERRADGRLHAYVPQFGIEGLDRAGRAAFEGQGVVVHPVDVRRIYTQNGTVRCLVNVLRRGASRRASGG